MRGIDTLPNIFIMTKACLDSLFFIDGPFVAHLGLIAIVIEIRWQQPAIANTTERESNTVPWDNIDKIENIAEDLQTIKNEIEKMAKSKP